MRSNLIAACFGFSALAASSAPGQIIPQSQISFTQGSSGTWNADWDGQSARTYFLQYSLDLKTWSFAPIIRNGSGLQGAGIQTENADKFFVRLKYTDDPAVDTLAKARAADFDGDGIPNAIEVENSGSDPYDANSVGPDSDGDRLPDGWEMHYFGNLDQDGYSDPDDDGYTVFEEKALGSDPNVADPAFTDSDQDGMPDVFETVHGLSTTADDSLEDADGDGIPNIFEYKNGSSPTNATDKAPFDYIVDGSIAADNPEGKTYRRIQTAIDKAYESPWDDENNVPGPPARPFQMIYVKSGVYRENLNLWSKPTLLVGEKGNINGPVVISGVDGGATVSIGSRTVLDGFVITHEPGLTGSGVEFGYWEDEPDEPAAFAGRRIANCIIRSNAADYGGGGIVSSDTRLTIDHCTIFNNTGESGGAGAGVSQDGGSLTLRNSIIWGNIPPAPETTATQLALTNGAALILSGVTPNIIGDENAGNLAGWIDETDPLLTPYGWLKSTSPCINAGGVAPGCPVTFDLNGERRDTDSAPDIGADEYLDGNSISDGDGVPDWAEGNDDADGLTAWDEYNTHGTNPFSTDSDGDGIPDGSDDNPLIADLLPTNPVDAIQVWFPTE